MVYLWTSILRTPRRQRFAGAEQGSRVLQNSPHFLCDRMRSTKHALRGRFRLLRTPAYKALLCLPMEGLRADVARLALGVVRAFLDGLGQRERDNWAAIGT